MQKLISSARLARYRIAGSVLHCVVWAGLSIYSWRADPNGLYFWLTLILLAYSLFILRIDVISHLQRRAAPPDNPEH